MHSSKGHQGDIDSSKGLTVLGDIAAYAKKMGLSLSPSKPKEPQILNLSYGGKVIKFIKQWDPNEHPRGYQGRFIDAPDEDKKALHRLKEGDIFVTQVGTFGVVTKQTEAGHVFTNFIDRDTGEVEAGASTPEPFQKVAKIGEAMHDAKPKGIEPMDVRDALNAVGGMPTSTTKLIAYDLTQWEQRNSEDGKWKSMEHHMEEMRSMDQIFDADFGQSSLQIGRYVEQVTGDEYFKFSFGPAMSDKLPNMRRVEKLIGLYANELQARVKKANALIQSVQEKEPLEAAKLAAANVIAEEAYYAGANLYHFLPEVADINDSTEVNGLEILLLDIQNNPRYGDQEKERMMGAARRAYEDAQSEPAPPMPEEAKMAAARAGVNNFMRKHYSGEWTGGDIDYEYFLDKDDPDVVAGWLTNYITIPVSIQKEGRDEEWIKKSLEEMDLHIADSVMQAEIRWKRRYRRHGVNAEQHSVEVLDARALKKRLDEWMEGEPDISELKTLDPSADDKWEGREAIARQVVLDIATRKHTQAGMRLPGEGKKLDEQFGLLDLDDLVFERQDIAEINQSLLGTEAENIDRPVFLQTGKLEDGILQVGRDYKRNHYAHGFVDTKFDKEMVELMEANGAKEAPNSQDLTEVFPYGGSGELYRGDALLIEEDEQSAPIPAEERWMAIKDMYLADIEEESSQLTPQNVKFNDLETATTKGMDILDEWRMQIGEAKREGKQPVESLNEINKKFAHELIETASDWGLEVEGSEYRAMAAHGTAAKPTGRWIEYVPHDQKGDHEPDTDGLTTGAATSQRGQVRLHGYTPSEAVEALNKLGIAGDLEPEVPYNAIMGGTRKFGRVAPIHSAYLRGEQLPPEIPALISHGVTGGTQDLLKILDTGAILPIAERTRLGITTASSTSEKGDVRSGLDEGTFAKIGWSTWGEAGITVALKPRVYLRRDVLVSERDYGGSPTRYNDYLTYKNRIREQVDLSDPATLFDPLEPEARGYHIGQVEPGDGNEWNLINGVPVEDWAFVKVRDYTQKMEVEQKLDILQHRGMIGSKPPVLVNDTDARKLVRLEGEISDYESNLKPADEIPQFEVQDKFPDAYVLQDPDHNYFWGFSTGYQDLQMKLTEVSPGSWEVQAGKAGGGIGGEINYNIKTAQFDTATEAIEAASLMKFRGTDKYTIGVDEHGAAKNATEGILMNFPVQGSQVEMETVIEDSGDPEGLEWLEYRWSVIDPRNDKTHDLLFRRNPAEEQYEVVDVTTDVVYASDDEDGLSVLERARDDILGAPPPGSFAGMAWNTVGMEIKKSGFFNAQDEDWTQKPEFNHDKGVVEWEVLGKRFQWQEIGHEHQIWVFDKDGDELGMVYNETSEEALKSAYSYVAGDIKVYGPGDGISAKKTQGWVALHMGILPKEVSFVPETPGDESSKPDHWTWEKNDHDMELWWNPQEQAWRVSDGEGGEWVGSNLENTMEEAYIGIGGTEFTSTPTLKGEELGKVMAAASKWAGVPPDHLTYVPEKPGFSWHKDDHNYIVTWKDEGQGKEWMVETEDGAQYTSPALQIAIEYAQEGTSKADEESFGGKTQAEVTEMIESVAAGSLGEPMHIPDTSMWKFTLANEANDVSEVSVWWDPGDKVWYGQITDKEATWDATYLDNLIETILQEVG